MADCDSSAASDDEYDYVSAIVIDNGSGLIKAGFEDQDEPVCVFPSVVGHLRDAQHQSDQPRKVGNDAIVRKSTMSLRYPVERGIVKSWDDMSDIWSHTFHNELKIEPENHAVLLTESPEVLDDYSPYGRHARYAAQEQMAQIMFETFGVPAMQVANQALLSLWSTGRTKGLVVECGYGVTHVVPFDHCHNSSTRALSHAIGRLDLGGRDLTEYMAQLLMKRGYTFPSPADAEILRDIKKKLNSVAQDFEQALLEVDASDTIETILAERWSKEKEIVRDWWCTDCLDAQTVRDIKETLAFVADSPEERKRFRLANDSADDSDEDADVDEEKYEMPDGSVITIGAERFRCIEPLFKPSLLGRHDPGLTQMVFDSIKKCDKEIQKDLADNIVLAGGTTMLRNFDVRFLKELGSLYPWGKEPRKVVMAGKYSAFRGGIFSCRLSSMEDKWILKEEYEECGKSAIYRKEF